MVAPCQRTDEWSATVNRPSWDAYFLDLAARAAMRSTCPRASVGCILTIDRRIVVSGFNGAISGDDHCTDAGCDMVGGHCLRTVHAEINAIADAARRGVAVAGATAYVTHLPCIACAKLLVSAGVQRIVYGATYYDGANTTFLATAGVDLHYMGVKE
jgi:dCMP deaminase